LEYGSLVLVSINGVSKKLPGVVWFKGELLSSTGTMFGIELHVSLLILIIQTVWSKAPLYDCQELLLVS